MVALMTKTEFEKLVSENVIRYAGPNTARKELAEKHLTAIRATAPIEGATRIVYELKDSKLSVFFTKNSTYSYYEAIRI